MSAHIGLAVLGVVLAALAGAVVVGLLALSDTALVGLAAHAMPHVEFVGLAALAASAAHVGLAVQAMALVASGLAALAAAAAHAGLAVQALLLAALAVAAHGGLQTLGLGVSDRLSALAVASAVAALGWKLLECWCVGALLASRFPACLFAS